MKTPILYVLLVGIICSCSKKDEISSETKLLGNWKLIEFLADPGDGSGTFQPIESEKTMEFKNDGTVTTNSSLCDPYSDEIISSGSFSLDTNTITTNCQNPNIATIGFELENRYLILNFNANEGYSQKFQKLN